MNQSRIRNFALIAHIDHGKSTLADRFMEKTGVLPPLQTKVPRIDRMELEIERGVTIKLKAVRMACSLPQIANSRTPLAESRLPVQNFVLNMIDTPGHADFSYEVSRSLAACEGALLLVDATQGVQAQTLSHYEKARTLGLTIIGVINKIDSPLAEIQETRNQMRELGIEGEILRISALRGEGIEETLSAIVKRIPPPRGIANAPLRALVFDSSFDPHLGVVSYIRVVDGWAERGEEVRFLGGKVGAKAKELGYFTPDREPTEKLSAGEVGYLATGLQDPHAVRVGDTVAKTSDTHIPALPGYQTPQSFVFASFFAQNVHFEDFRRAILKLRLEEPSITISEVSSLAFGRGYRIGFLGTFHLEIVKERLEREFGLKLTATKPTLAFRDLSSEPWIGIVILTPPEFLSGIAKLVAEKRGKLGETKGFGKNLKVFAELPLLEFVRGFYDVLKSISRGYASLSWEFLEDRPAELCELSVLVHGWVIEGLSEVVPKGEAEHVAREKLKKLKDILPRQQFSYAVQAKVGGRIIAREDVPALAKNVLAKLSGGHVERKLKKLEEQKKGKKRLAKFGRVEVPPEAFLV